MLSRLLLSLLLLNILPAQEKIETCSRACKCHQMISAMQTAAETQCGKLAGKHRIECLGKIPFHCDLIEMRPYQIEDWLRSIGVAQIDELFAAGTECSIHCRLGDCKCNQDGATCHIGHRAKDHTWTSK